MRMRFTFLLFSMVLSAMVLKAQDSQEDTLHSKINVSADIFSRYIWRGLDFGSAPSVQPTLEYAHKCGLTVGYWGAFNFTGTYNEIDLYLTYGIKNFEITATDYFFPVSGVPVFSTQRYFNYNNSTTGHGFEGSLKWKGTEKFPLALQVGTFFYGADKNNQGDQNYSTYIEALYTLEKKAGKLDFFMGFTPQKGLYGNTMGVVNMGVTSYRDIKITDDFTLPMQVSVIANPQVSNIYFVLGFSL